LFKDEELDGFSKMNQQAFEEIKNGPKETEERLQVAQISFEEMDQHYREEEPDFTTIVKKNAAEA
jgi:hypothetical protein